ncbi:TPA: RNA methyltransferase [Streptococcus suis]
MTIEKTLKCGGTWHLECVALLSKLDTEHHINIKIDEEDFSSINIKKDVTYPEIKEYVLNKFGFKVSSLYIAQVKRKYDLIERKNYNLSRKADGDQHVTNCPKEKEDAIKDALRYFGMI